MGCFVIATDRNSNAIGLTAADIGEAVDITDVNGILAISTRHRIDGVLAINDYGVKTAAAVAELLALPGLPTDVARTATNKRLMREAWKGQAFNVRYSAVTTFAEARQAAREIGFPVILKPANSEGGGSRGVSRVGSLDDLPSALSFAQEFYPDKQVIVEQCLIGLEHSLEMVMTRGKAHAIMISDKVKTSPPYRVDKSVVYPTNYGSGMRTQLAHAAAEATRLIGVEDGVVHVELCSTPEGVYVFDFGARCGGGGTPDPIAEWVSGVNELKEAIRLALGEAPCLNFSDTERGCVYRFLTPQPGQLGSVEGVESLRAWPGILDAGVLVEPGQTIRPVRTGADRAGFLIAGAVTRSEALELADRAEQQIKFVLDS
jgi:biotin carboxylase